jgi:hypothetical protein
MKIKLNSSWNFQRNRNVLLVLLEKSWWSRIQWNLFGKIWIQNVGDIDFSWERGNTWKLAIQFKHDFLSYLAVQKIDTYIAKQCSHVEFPYFVMGSHLGQ